MTRHNKILRRTTLIKAGIASLIMFARILQAEVIFYEGFEYGNTDGYLSTIASADWTALNTYDLLYKNTSLIHASVTSNGGSAKTQPNWGSGNKVEQALSIDLTTKDEFWVSILLASDNATHGTDSSAIFYLSTTQNSWEGSKNYYLGKAWGNTTAYGFGTLSYVLTSLNGAEFATVGTDTIRIVYYLKKSTVPEVWVNPMSTPTPGTGQQLGAAVKGNLTSIDKITIEFLGATVSFDEFIVGDTYADVSAPIIPVLEGTVLIVE